MNNPDSEDETGGGRGGPRSPARRGRSGAGRVDEVVEESDESSEDSGDPRGTPAVDDESDDGSVDLCQLQEAQDWHPLQVLPQGRANAEAAQPLLSLPMAPNLDPRAYDFRATAPSTELDFLYGIARDEASEGQSLLHEEEGVLTSDAKAALGDGLQVGEAPTLTSALLQSAEPLPEALVRSIDGMDASLHLARATHRLIREARADGEREAIKTRFEAKSNGIEAEDRRGARGQRGKENEESQKLSSNMLRQLSVGPVMKIAENPLDERASVPVVTDTSRSVGGVLGNWGPDASIRERLGPLAVAHDKRSGCRSVLRLHLHQMHLHEHPLMNAEEVQFGRLKNTFSMYRSLVEQQTLLFLSERLQVVEKELQRLMRLHAQHGDDLDADEGLLLKALYFDLCETVPLLTELRLSVDSLTTSILDQWRQIKEHRRSSGFTSTRATVTVRPVRGSGGGAGGVSPRAAGGSPRKTRGGRNDDDAAASAEIDEPEDDSSDGWDSLVECLARVPSLVPKVQIALMAMEMAKLDEEESAVEAEANGGVQAFGDSEKPAKPVKPSRKGAELALERPEKSPRVTMSATVEMTPRTKTEQIKGSFKRHAAGLEIAVAELTKCRCLLPEYWLRVDQDGAVTPTSQLDTKEQSRRAAVEDSRFKAVVCVNGNRVTETKLCSLSYPQLSVDLAQFFEFRLLHEMDTLSIDIVSSTPAWGGFMSSEKILTTVCVPFPGQLEKCNAPGVGSRQNQAGAHLYAPISGWLHFTSSDQPGDSPNTETDIDKINAQLVRGSILVVCEYDVSSSAESKHTTESAFSGVDEANLAVLPPPGEVDKATAWGSGYNLGGGLTSTRLLPSIKNMDPNDPRNDVLASRATEDPMGMNKKVFHLFGHNFAVAFSEGGESYDNYLRFKEGPRSQLLRLRQQSPHLFTEPIPLTDAEIRSSELYRRLLTQHVAKSALVTDEDEEQPDASRSKLKSFLERVRNSSTAQSKRARKKKLTTSAAVAETQYFFPIVEIDLENLLPEKKRSLKPKSQARAQTAMHVNQASLLVQIVGARNIPLRQATDDVGGQSDMGPRGGSMSRGNTMRGGSPRKQKTTYGEGGDSDGGNSDSEKPQVAEALLDANKVTLRKRAQTCVEVRFQENREMTTAIPGGAPIWKQSFSIPFRPPNDDYTPSNLAQIRDVITFSLFDVVEEDDAKRGMSLEGENTKRIERRFLGSFTLPFNTVYMTGRVEGIFRLHTPLLNFGYVPAGPIAAPITQDDQLFDDDLQTEAVVAKPSFFETVIYSCFKVQHVRRNTEFGNYINDNTARELEGYASGDGSTYINLMATLDPLLSTLPEIPMDMSASNLFSQDRPFGPYASIWLQQLKNYSQCTKDRNFKVFGSSSEGLHTLICRYLHPQCPPRGFRSKRGAIHLVSHLPYMSDVHSFADGVDFWCTTKEAWEVGAGDDEEHAVMLYNYLYYMSIMGEEDSKSPVGRSGNRRRGEEVNSGAYPSDEAINSENVFLILGKGAADGDTCYILLRDQNVKSVDPYSSKNFLIISPCTGQVFSAMDPSCPLREIYCLATPYNIWGNVQYTSKIYESSFNVLDVDMWRPFFGTRLPPPSGGLHTVQDELTYTPTSAGYALEVETSVLAGIKNSMRRWRSKRYRSTTTFHPDGCALMHEMMPKLEAFKHGSLPSNVDIDRIMGDVEKRMAPILRTRSFRGSPVNLSFTDLDEVLNKVKSLGVHESRHPEVQFVLAVKAIPLVNGVVSLWVFLGTLEAHGNRQF